ncbi:adenosylmethionine decarboxylase [Actibacterium mucosum]|nr:adenosylmethionine decarboxylase [Actibacterium mucosum]
MDDAKYSPGLHVLADFHGCTALDDLGRIEAALVAAANAAGATVLECSFHHFGGAGGVTGVVLLAESHISIHTWPESGFAAIDIFMCGTAQPLKALQVLRDGLQPKREQITEVARSA